ncbi:kinase-like domain, phloem protein 2-like protein, partial [Tanacetum coccineum]
MTKDPSSKVNLKRDTGDNFCGRCEVLEISVGIRLNALSYTHHDETRDFSVIHRNIDSEVVLLNDNWEAKLSGFEFSMKVSASERHLSFDTDKVLNRKAATKEKAATKDDQDNKYLASVAVARYREKKLNEIIGWDLWNQMDSQSFNLFAEIAYDCLNEERSQRPSIDQIVPRLEKVLELQREHENADLISRIEVGSIQSATNNFDDKNVLLRGGYEMRYHGHLPWSGEVITITARKFNKDIDEMFLTELSLLSSLKHQNLVSLVGFCDENGEKIIIT